jgi:hypothetical protein
MQKYAFSIRGIINTDLGRMASEDFGVGNLLLINRLGDLNTKAQRIHEGSRREY